MVHLVEAIARRNRRGLIWLAVLAVAVAAVALPAVQPATAASNPDVLVFGDADNGYEADNAATTLESLGLSVARTNRLPSDLSTYQQIWYVEAYRGLDPNEETALADYLQEGGSVYLTGERPCCEGLNASVQRLLRQVLTDQNIQVGGLGDIDGPFTFNFDAVGGVAAEPNVLVDFVPHSPGGMDGLLNVSSRNVFAASATIPVGAAWSEEDMQSRQGRIALLMDIDWLGDAAREPIIENLHNFLAHGGSCSQGGHWAGFAWSGEQTSTHNPANCSTVLTPGSVKWEVSSDEGPLTLSVEAKNGAVASCESTLGSNFAEATCAIQETGTSAGRLVVTAADSRGSTVRRYKVVNKNDPRNVPTGWSISSDWWDWPDDDDDGIPNVWETRGVYVDNRYLDLPALGANPEHKDLFVHLDYEQGHALSSGVLERVRTAFRQGPLTNPDGTQGVDLHIEQGSAVPQSIIGDYDLTSDDIVRVITYTGFASSPGSGGSGVPQIFKHFVNHGSPKVKANGDMTVGRAMVKGDYGWTALDDADAITAPLQVGILNGNAADFMRASNLTHELGHTLGLRHHGASHNPNSDPRYKSVMSYAYSLIGLPDGFMGARGKIDYSRAGDRVNEDWRRGPTFGALTFVAGQDGEIHNFYERSANSTVPLYGDGPSEEAPAQEVLGQSDPQRFEEFAGEFGIETHNAFPTVSDVTKTAVRGGPVRISLEGRDPDGTSVRFQVMDASVDVSAAVDGTDLVVDGARLPAGEYTFMYRAESEGLCSGWGTASLTLVDPPATAPSTPAPSPPGPRAGVKPVLVPGKVTHIRHALQGGRLTIKWKAVRGATSYRIGVAGSSSGKKKLKWHTVTVPRYSLKAHRHRTYRIRIMAVSETATGPKKIIRIRT